jgi:PhnB protein
MKRKAPRKNPPAKKSAARKKKVQKVQPIPAGYRSVTAYLSVRGAAQAIEFYKQAFGAVETLRLPGAGGTIGHAEIRIGDSVVMLSDEYAPLAFLSPQARGGTTVHLHLYVRDVDATVARAVAAGAKLARPVEDQFYGDRRGTIEDPNGHVWHVATHTEDPSDAEVKRRLRELAKKTLG